jgi:hypothetical protein
VWSGANTLLSTVKSGVLRVRLGVADFAGLNIVDG